MFDGQFVFAQLMDFLPRREFNAASSEYRGDRRWRGFSCRDQFLCSGICAAHVSRKPARHRNVPAGAGDRSCITRAFAARFRGARWPTPTARHDWRIYADFAQVLIRRARKLYADEPLAVDLEADGLRARFDDHRLVLELVSVGQVSPPQRGGQAAHAARPARQHSLFCAHFPRENARCDRARPTADRAGRVLRDGSRLRRFPAAVSLHARRGVLRDARQTEPRLHAPRASRRSTRRRACAAIRRSSWRVPSRRGCIPIRCAASRSTTPSTNGGWCS